MEIRNVGGECDANLENIVGAAAREAHSDLDRRLRALSGRSSRCRLIEGWLARDFLERRMWQPLGFVRLRDYTRERLGIGARCLEEEVHVAAALRNLPRLTSAFLDGTLTWTAVRILIDVASTRDEAQWIEKSRSLSSRALTELVREARGVKPDATVTNGEDEDPRLRWSVRVSHSGRVLWRTATELAQRVSGSNLTPAQVLELVAAEAGSGVTGSEDLHPLLDADCLALLERLRNGILESAPAEDGRSGRRTANAEAEVRLADDDGESSHRGIPSAKEEGSSDDAAATAPDPAWFGKLIAKLGESEGFPWLGTPSPADASGPVEWFEAERAGLEAADPHTIDARLREVRRALQGCEFELATLLREAADCRLYRSLGFANLETYVETCLGICARTVWSLLSVARASRRSCPLLGEAWRDGHVSWLAVRILAPVVSATNGREWVERAQIVTLRRLEAEVEWAQGRRDEHCDTCHDNHDSFEVPGPPPLDHDLGDAVAALDIDRLQMRAQAPGPDEQAGNAEGYLPQVQITFFAPASVVTLAEDTLLRLRSGSEPRGRVFERMLALAMLEWVATPAHRDPVFERDGWRCAVPGCTSRRNLHDHHVVFRSHGGGNDRDNRITVCAAHHLHGIHRGRVRAHGTAPHGMEWELGCRHGGGGPMARYHGDRYV